MANILEGKVAIITGSNSGIGAATVQSFLEQGAKVAGLDIAEPTTSDNASLHIIKCDVSSDEAVDVAVKEVVDMFGTVDILINCAGVMDGFERAGDTPNATWSRCLNINLNGPFYLTRACIPHFLAKESHPKGSIVNVCSVAALGGGAAGTAYTVSKHALLGLTRSTAWMYRHDGIRCSAVLPGGVATNIYQNSNVSLDPAGQKALAAYHACRTETVMKPESIAKAILFLAVTEHLSGTELVVDEAWTAA